MLKKILRRHSWAFNKQFWRFVLLIIISGIVFFFIPPINFFVIALFFLLLAAAFFCLTAIFLSKKIALVAGLSLFILLTMKALHVIDPLNLALLISFSIALGILLYQ